MSVVVTPQPKWSGYAVTLCTQDIELLLAQLVYHHGYIIGPHIIWYSNAQTNSEFPLPLNDDEEGLGRHIIILVHFDRPMKTPDVIEYGRTKGLIPLRIRPLLQLAINYPKVVSDGPVVGLGAYGYELGDGLKLTRTPVCLEKYVQGEDGKCGPGVHKWGAGTSWSKICRFAYGLMPGTPTIRVRIG